MINKKTTGVPNVDRVTDDIYNHLNKMTSTPSVGTKGERGNTGIQGIQGVTGSQGITGSQGVTGGHGLVGAQGVTGVGYNYTLTHGSGITGPSYNGTSNVTWLDDYKKDYGDGRRKIFTNWVMQGSTVNPTGKWIKVFDFTLVVWARVLISGIIRNQTDIFRLAEHRLGLSAYATDTTSRIELLFENTNSSEANIFDDAKLLRTNSTIPFTYELWLHIDNGYGSGYKVAGDFTWGSSGGFTTYNWYEGLITAYDNLPTYNTMYSINITGRYGPQGIQGSQGSTGVGYNYTLTPGAGLTGMPYNGTGNVTIVKDNADTFFGSLYTKYVNWGASSNGNTDKWMMVASGTITGSWSTFYLYADIYGSQGAYQAMSKQTLQINVYNTSTDIATVHYTLLDTVNTAGLNIDNNIKPFKALKVIRRSGSGVTNNVIEVWLQMGNSFGSTYAKVNYNVNVSYLLTNRTAALDAITTGYVSEITATCSSCHDKLIVTAETATTPAYQLVHESTNSIIKRVPFIPDHIGVERTLVIASGQTQQWVTIATCATARAYSEFLVYDTDSGKHNICKLIASTSYGKNNITVLFGNRYGTITILNARILYNVADRTYGGAKLQVYIDATCTLRVRQLYNATITGWKEWDDTTPVIDTWYPSWAQDNDTLRTDITSSLYSIHGNVEGSVKAGSYIQLDTLTNNRVVVSDASNRLNSSTVTSTELSYLTGKNSVIDGSGNASYIPVFSSTNRLASSHMVVDDYSVCLNNAPSNWGSSFAAYQVGNMSFWANYNFVNGYGAYISNNRYHDGTGNKPVVSGSSSTYEQTGSTHKFYINNGLTAGTAFTPTEIVNISSDNIRFNIAGGDGLDFSGSNGYMNKISATNGANSQLVLQSKQATMTMHGDWPLILFSVDCYFYGGITTVNSITSGVDLIATRYVVSNTVRTPDTNGMLTLAGEGASSATIFINGLLAHQPDTITSGSQTINPNTSYVRLYYNNTSQTYTLGTVAYMTNTRVIIANMSNVAHTVVYGGTSSTLNAGQFREFIRDTYNNTATWLAEW